MHGKKILIACKVFEKELFTVLPPEANYDLLWLDTGLHADIEKLEATLAEALDRASATCAEIKVFYGTGCHPDICRLARRHGAGIPPVKNCIEAFCGAQTRELEKNRTMIMTPGWIRAWQSIMEAQGWDQTDARINMGIYDRILLLETGVAPISDEEILEFFEIVQVPVEVKPMNLDRFRRCVLDVLK